MSSWEHLRTLRSRHGEAQRVSNFTLDNDLVVTR